MPMPETDMFGKPWPTNPYQAGLQQTLGGSPGTSNTMPVDGAKRDQWSGAGTVTGGNLGRMEGYDAKNFNDPNMQTAKYQAGRIFSRFDPNDGNALQSILNDPEFKRLFGNAKGVGPDKIDFGDGRPVDVIRGHGAPGAAFSWQTMDDAGTSGASNPVTSGAVAPITSGGAPAMPGQQSDLMAQILAALQSQQEPDQQAILQQAMR